MSPELSLGAAPILPSSRGCQIHPIIEDLSAGVGLFGLHPAGIGCEKSVNLIITVFDASGLEGGVWESYAEAPWTGSHGALESLREKFVGMKVNGEWTLEVYDSEVDGIGGTLDEFKHPLQGKALRREVRMDGNQLEGVQAELLQWRVREWAGV